MTDEVISDVKDDVKDEITEAPAPSEVEEKALKGGWIPKSEFKGDPAKWRSAEEFVERGETLLPIMKATVARQAREIAALERAQKEVTEYLTRSEKLAYDRAIKDLKAKQIEAVSVADTETFAKLDQEIAELSRETPRPPAHVKNTDDPVFTEWLGRNKWAESDEVMIAYAETQGEFLTRTTNKRGSDLLEEITKEVKAKFPNKFTNPRRDEAPPVEGGSPPSRKGGKTFADLPAEAKAACERMEKNYGVKRADYLKNFFEEV